LQRVATLAWLLLTIGAVFLVREYWPREVVVEKVVVIPAVPETIRVNLPGETDTIFIVKRDTINTTITRTVYDTVRVECQDLQPRRRIVAASFGSAVGDTALVLTELMSSSNESLVFQQTTESIYSLGIPRRIGTDLEGATIEWQEIPTTTVNSCSLWSRIAHLSLGAAGGIVIGEVFQ
jgi:hypothetical protein